MIEVAVFVFLFGCVIALIMAMGVLLLVAWSLWRDLK